LLVMMIYIGKLIVTPPPVTNAISIDLDPDSIAQLNLKSANHGGGGGGEHNKIEAEIGKTPKADLHPLAPVSRPIENPALAVDPAVLVQPEIKLPDNPALQNFGVKNSPNVTLASMGTGGPAGLGAGTGNGVGTGKGSGYGPGEGGNFGGGLYSIGGDVSKPIVISSVDPEFTDEARRAKYQGVVLVGLIVDAQGNPQNVHVVRAIGYGLDEKAVEAVKQYKFKPAIKQGKGPVPVQLSIYVNFRIY
jgi:TonB family protein